MDQPQATKKGTENWGYCFIGSFDHAPAVLIPSFNFPIHKKIKKIN